MPNPVRHRLAATWSPIANEPWITTYGFAFEYPFLDPRDCREARDPDSPPVLAEWFWRNAEVGNIVPVPDLRGAVFAHRIYPLDAGTHLEPTDDRGLAQHWWSNTTLDHPEYARLPWRAEVHEGLRKKVAFFTPTVADGTEAGPPASGHFQRGDVWYDTNGVRWLCTASGNPGTWKRDGGGLNTVATKAAAPYCRSFAVQYQLLTPQEKDDKLQASGIRIEWGVTGHPPAAHYRLLLPNHDPDDTSTTSWTLERLVGIDRHKTASYEVVDQQRAPHRGAVEGQTEPREEWVMVQPVAGSLLITHSRLGDRQWVYSPEGGCYPREGKVSVTLYGSAGWCSYGMVLYPTSVTVAGPWTSRQPNFTLAGRARVKGRLIEAFAARGLQTDFDDLSEWGDGRWRCRVRANSCAPVDTPDGWAASGSRGTPLLLSVQDIHDTVLGTPAAVATTDLSAALLAAEFTHPESGRGATAKLRLRNFQMEHGAPKAGSAGYLDDVLRGLGRVTLYSTAAYGGGGPDASPVLMFTGWMKARPARVGDGLWPTLELELADRSFFWEGSPPRACMLDMPDFAGWDFVQACAYILARWGVPEDQMIAPSGYSGRRVQLPWQDGGRAFTFEPTCGITDALDKLCERAGFRWFVRRDGAVEFADAQRPTAGLTPAFVLDESTVTPQDVLAPLEATLDYDQIRNVSYVRGISRWGGSVDEYVTYPAGMNDPTNPLYTGWPLWAVTVDPDNSAPARVANRRLLDYLSAGLEVNWSSIARDTVWPGDVVQVTVGHLGVPAGTWFKVSSKKASFPAASEGLRRRDEFTGRIVAGGVVV